jgi:hypothetical protein
MKLDWKIMAVTEHKIILLKALDFGRGTNED